MMGKRRDIDVAVKALVAAAVPTAVLYGFDDPNAKPTEASAGGDVYGHPGDGEIVGADLSPLTYHIDHTNRIEISPPEFESDPDQWLDQAMGLIGAAVIAERLGDRFGGLAQWIEARPAQIEDEPIDGHDALRWAGIEIVTHYSTHDPLN